MPELYTAPERTTRKRSPKTRQNPLPTEPTEEQIRARAYQIYLARGTAPGSPGEDWRQAEMELRARIALLGKP
jgi:hypothetical protein